MRPPFGVSLMQGMFHGALDLCALHFGIQLHECSGERVNLFHIAKFQDVAERE